MLSRVATFPFYHQGDFGFPSSDLSTLLRLFDNETQRTGRKSGQPSVRGLGFPCDVFETSEGFVLDGELPGIDREDIGIEFVDPTTLVIKGHIERGFSGPGDAPQQGRITGDVGDQQQQSHKATVEDETQDGQQQVAQNGQQDQQQSKVTKKIWVLERSVGDFSRTFSFPVRVDQDNVKANLKNGLLHVFIPKATAHEAKKISIE